MNKDGVDNKTSLYRCAGCGGKDESDRFFYCKFCSRRICKTCHEYNGKCEPCCRLESY